MNVHEMAAGANRKQTQRIGSNFIKGAKCFDFLCVGKSETSERGTKKLVDSTERQFYQQ